MMFFFYNNSSISSSNDNSSTRREKQPSSSASLRSILKSNGQSNRRRERHENNLSLSSWTVSSSVSLLSSSVRFGSIEVFEHELELNGSAALPSSGPSVGLSWKRSSYKRYDSFEEFTEEKKSTEKERGRRIKKRDSGRWIDHNLDVSSSSSRSLRPQPPQERIDRLLDLGFTADDIRSSIRQNSILRRERNDSSNDLTSITVKKRRPSLKISPKIHSLFMINY